MAADASDYPTSADSIPRTSPSDNLTGHSDLHDKMADAIEEIQGFVGVSGDTTAGTVVKRITDLEGKDITVTFGAGSDLDGSFTITNLGNVTNTTVSVRDDSHNHVISNVDGLQSALDGKQPAGSYQPAGTYLTPNISNTLVRINSPAGLEIETNGGQTNGLEIYQPTVGDDAAMMFHVNSQYAVLFGLDGYTGELYVGGWSKGANRYKMWHEGNFSPSSYLTTSGTAANSDKLDNLDSTQFLRSDAADTGTGTITISKNAGQTWSNAQFVADGGSGTASVALRSYTSNIVQLRAGANGITGRNMLYIRDSGDQNDQDLKVADLVAGGNIYYAGATLAHSSRKVKENIEDYDGATSVIEQLRPVTFQFINGNGSTQIGLIAEEVQEVLPSAVDDISDVLSLNQNSLLGLALAGLKEANKRIAVLEARVAELEAG